jgi:hypothetical protein
VRKRSATPRHRRRRSLAEDRLDFRLKDLSARMDRVERLLIKLTEE